MSRWCVEATAVRARLCGRAAVSGEAVISVAPSRMNRPKDDVQHRAESRIYGVEQLRLLRCCCALIEYASLDDTNDVGAVSPEIPIELKFVKTDYLATNQPPIGFG
jgi:hypothetical protein